MAKYLVIAPDKEMVHLCPSNYGMKSYKHGTYMTDDVIAKMYPNLFVMIPDGVEVKTEVKKAKQEEPKKELLNETKKRGRPSKVKEEKPKKNSIFKR